MDRHSGTQVTVLAPAKLNLFLEILARRQDGFHELETVMTGIDLFDHLSCSRRNDGQLSLDIVDLRPDRPNSRKRASKRSAEDQIPSDNQNLVIQALDSLRVAAGIDGGANVRLCKRIPSQAGLGGGSSNAAAALLAGNRLWNIGWSRNQLMPIASGLGSDVPFFLEAGTSLCLGRGEKIRPLHHFGRHWYVVVKPPIGLSTPDVFRAATVPTAPRRFQVHRVSSISPANLGSQMFNRLQSAAAVVTPWVASIREIFHELDVLAHQLTGSGSSYFALCRNAKHAIKIANRIRSLNLGAVFRVTDGQRTIDRVIASQLGAA